MKRILSLILALVLCAGCLTACDSGSSSSSSSEETTSSSSISLEDKAEWDEQDAIQAAMEEARKTISNYSSGLDPDTGTLVSLKVTKININNGSCEDKYEMIHDNGGKFICYRIRVKGTYKYTNRLGYIGTEDYDNKYIYIHSDKTEHNFDTEQRV